MTGAARSLFVFGIYLSALGVLLLLSPNLLLRIFGAPPTNDIWIRVNGMFVICFAYYYIQAAIAPHQRSSRNEIRQRSDGQFILAISLSQNFASDATQRLS